MWEQEEDVNLTQAQKNILFDVQNDRDALPHFDVLCAHLEAALDQVTDTDATSPFGMTAIMTEGPGHTVTSEDDATVIAVAWLAAIAEAINDQDDEIDPVIFDDDGVPVFTDTRPLFEVAAACGYGPGHIRLVFARVRESGVVPRRAFKILGKIRAIRPRKRKERLHGRKRIVSLMAPLAADFDRNEIARAKAGSVIYSLVTRRDGYEVVRIRKMKARQMFDSAGAPIDVISEGDVVDGFHIPLIPHDDVHGLALAQFVQFLDEEREDKVRHTYQRIIHRTA